MKVLKVMDSRGDSRIEFDETQAEAAATLEAKGLFEKLTRNGAAVFAVNRSGGATDKKVTSFNELEQDNVVVPRIVGG